MVGQCRFDCSHFVGSHCKIDREYGEKVMIRVVSFGQYVDKPFCDPSSIKIQTRDEYGFVIQNIKQHSISR